MFYVSSMDEFNAKDVFSAESRCSPAGSADRDRGQREEGKLNSFKHLAFPSFAMKNKTKRKTKQKREMGREHKTQDKRSVHRGGMV